MLATLCTVTAALVSGGPLPQAQPELNTTSSEQIEVPPRTDGAAFRSEMERLFPSITVPQTSGALNDSTYDFKVIRRSWALRDESPLINDVPETFESLMANRAQRLRGALFGSEPSPSPPVFDDRLGDEAFFFLPPVESGVTEADIAFRYMKLKEKLARQTALLHAADAGSAREVYPTRVFYCDGSGRVESRVIDVCGSIVPIPPSPR